jgi:hypothetical protein
LQELRDTRISYPDGELNLGPNYGRRYEIFYYQKKLAYYKSTPLGRVMTSEGLLFSEYITGIRDYGVSVDIALDASERVIPYNALKDYLFNLARMLSSDRNGCHYTEHQYRGMTQRDYANYAIEQAMIRAIWDNAPVALHFFGTPTGWIEYIDQQQRDANVSGGSP